MGERLKNSKSPYLRKASQDLVDWHDWSDEAFKKAKLEDKPILLSIGAVWCHWCHVMAHECYRNHKIAEFINQNFIPIKVDRDERPDIDRRYQEAVHILAGTGGWPLTVFLTPEGHAFFGGTYFPPEPRYGKPSFLELLQRVIDVYRSGRDKIEGAAEEVTKLMEIQKKQESTELPSIEFINEKVKQILSSIDLQNGGFGKNPKFYFAPTLEFLLDFNIIKPMEIINQLIIKTLDKMAMGGVYDHLLGGFFRYSTDDKWLIPHFEKMLYDNALLLKLYAKAWRMFKKELYLEVVNGIVRYYRDYGSSPDVGFFSSQDADIGELDEGGYYTFTYEDIEKILTSNEFRIISQYFGVSKHGNFHNSKNVLYIAKTPEEIAEIEKMSSQAVKEIINSAKAKMLKYREQRETPYIDNTIYTDLNGMMIESLAISGRLLKNPELIAMAERAVRRIFKENYRNGKLLHSQDVEGFADDYVFFAKGLFELYQVTANEEYLTESLNLVKKALELFSDNGGLLYDTAEGKEQGYLRLRSKVVFDNPAQSSNGVLPYLLICFYNLTADKSYMDLSIKMLNELVPYIESNPIFTGSSLRSLFAYSIGIRKIETRDYFEEALYDIYPFAIVLKKDIDGVIICQNERCEKFDDYK
ncbi:thioredoxin domain-containing protein [Thermodesulfovibrio hydrogeniphilus]